MSILILCNTKCNTTKKKPRKYGAFSAETEGFEPSYRDEPINAFRVRRVTAASLRLQDVCLFKRQTTYYYTYFLRFV